MELTDKQLDLASKLTTLQRKFVVNLVGSDMSQREAYIAAGGKAKTPATQDSSASEILSNPKVRAFYDSLMESATSAAILTREEALQILSINAKLADECRDQHAAIKQISDMQGWNAPKKSELTGAGGKPLAIQADVSSPEVASALAGLMEKL